MLKNIFKNSILKIILEVYLKLSKKDKKLLLLVILSSLISSFAEFSSLGLVIPSLKLIFSDDISVVNFNFWNFYIPENFRFLTLIIFALIFILIGIIKVFCLKFCIKEISKIGSKLFKNSLKGILRMDLKTHNLKNSSVWISTLTEGSTAVQFAFLQFSILISSLILFIFSLGLIISIETKITFPIILIGSLCYGISYKYSKSKLENNDKIIKNSFEKRLLKLRESIGNIRQILLYNLSDFFTNDVYLTDYELRKAQASNHIMGSTPKAIIESIAIVMLLLLAFLLSLKSKDNIELISEIGLIAVATSKVLQGLNATYLSWAAITGRKKIIREFIKLVDLNYVNKDNINLAIKNLNWKKLVLKDVSFCYPGSDNKVLKKVNMTIKNGEKIGIIGSTGSGKSTLTDIIMGLLEPLEGEVLLDGKNIYKSKSLIKKWRFEVGHVPQDQFFSDDKLIKNLISSNPLIPVNEKRISKILNYASIDFAGKTVEEIYRKKIGENGCLLSGGQRQRISIAKALYREPSILILDEATSSLDKFTESEILKKIYKFLNKITIISISHNLQNLKESNKIYEIKEEFVFEHESYK